MVVRIRLARFGQTHAPLYNIVVCQARSARNSKPMEVLGTYSPLPKADPFAPISQKSVKIKDVVLDTARTKYWLGVGAQPSEPVWKLLSKIGLVEPDLLSTLRREQAKEADKKHAQNPYTPSTETS